MGAMAANAAVPGEVAVTDLCCHAEVESAEEDPLLPEMYAPAAVYQEIVT
jgi:hypothetical protein